MHNALVQSNGHEMMTYPEVMAWILYREVPLDLNRFDVIEIARRVMPQNRVPILNTDFDYRVWLAGLTDNLILADIHLFNDIRFWAGRIAQPNLPTYPYTMTFGGVEITRDTWTNLMAMNTPSRSQWSQPSSPEVPQTLH